MSTNTDTDKEKPKASSYELLREVARRLKEEIFLLGLAISFLVAQVAIFAREFSAWIAATFIALYSISAACYLVIKTRQIGSQLKEESKECIQWKVGYPNAFQNPYEIAEKRPELSIVQFPINFTLKNQMKKSMMFKVYVRSPTQAVGFAWESPRKIWKRQLGIIPYREEVDLALDDWETRYIDAGQEEKVAFRGLYRPRLAYDAFVRRREIVLTFRIIGRSDPLGISYVDTHEKKLYIPFKDEVRYESELKKDNKS